MGLQWRKRIGLSKGLKLNLSLKSLGLSAGGRGAHIGINSRRGARGSVGIPGSGLFYTFGLGGKRKGRRAKSKDNPVVGAGALWMLIALFTPVTAAWAFGLWILTCGLIAGKKK